MIYILEDNPERIQQFRTASAKVAPGVPVRIWHNAHAMIADLVEGLEHASLISLDHDLNRPPDEEDPGTGYEVAKLLGELSLLPRNHPHKQRRTGYVDGRRTVARWLAI